MDTCVQEVLPELAGPLEGLERWVRPRPKNTTTSTGAAGCGCYYALSVTVGEKRLAAQHPTRPFPIVVGLEEVVAMPLRDVFRGLLARVQVLPWVRRCIYAGCLY